MKSNNALIIYVDGSGADPNGISGCAWLIANVNGDRKHVEWARDWTNNEAEYRAVLSALRSLPKGVKQAQILSDSDLMILQLRDEYATRHHKLRDLREEIERVISSRGLDVSWKWIPRNENKADKLLRHRPNDIRQVENAKHTGKIVAKK